MVSNLIDSFSDRFAVVQFHVGDAYQTPFGNERAAFYNIWSDGVPWFAYDGLFDAWPISAYETNLRNRMRVATPVTMDVSVTELTGNWHRIKINVCLEETAAAHDLRLYAVVVEDHYPSYPSYSRNTYRATTPTVDITLQPGECYEDTRDVEMDSSWDPDELKVIAWAQEPLNQYPAEVHQAAKAIGPFEPLPGDLDGDCDVDLSDLSQLLANYGTTGGATYEDGDLDGDGDVDLSDLSALLANYGISC
ncbi:MAG: hypothetical protein KKI02_03720 [Planctomycetes bacterium]|nr:hypothetical protein [Planctomycetota bacterium]